MACLSTQSSPMLTADAANVCARVMAEQTLPELIRAIADTACALTQSRAACAGYGVVNGALATNAAAHSRGSMCPQALELFSLIRSGACLDLVRGRDCVRLDERQLRERALLWGLPDGLAPLAGLIAVRLTGTDRHPNGMIVVVDRAGGEFTIEDERMLRQLAMVASVSVANVEARRRAEEQIVQLRQENRAKDEFVAALSHELRTPLNGILGWTDLLCKDVLDRSQHARALATIKRNARTQAQLLEDLLDINRIVTGRLYLEHTVVNLNRTAERVVEMMRPCAEEKHVSIDIDASAEHPSVHGDAARLQQVIWNLVGNAIKFSLEGGRVHVAVTNDDENVVLTVRDSGIGIEAESLPYVFEPFRQVDASASRRALGLGLGLAIVKHLVDLHSGSVRVESDGPGHGACLSVTLPAVVEPAPPEDSSDNRKQAVLTGTRLLVVEDDSDGRELLSMGLQNTGAIVRTASNADDALAVLSDEAVDVMLVDLALPGDDGYVFLAKARAMGSGAPAIAVTGYGRRQDRLRTQEAGFLYHLTKPVELSRVVETIATVMQEGLTSHHLSAVACPA